MLWLSRKDIEHISRRLLRDYLKKVPQKVDHIDPADFAEKMCGLQFTFADISEAHDAIGLTATSGVIITIPQRDGTRLDYELDGKTAFIDQSLVAENQIGRLNFTMMHEAAHQLFWMLYPEEYEVQTPRCVFRMADEHTQYPVLNWEEWQTNVLTSYLLLPKELVYRHMADVGLKDGVSVLNRIYARKDYERFSEAAKRLGVSKTALTIRSDANTITVQEAVETLTEEYRDRLEEISDTVHHDRQDITANDDVYYIRWQDVLAVFSSYVSGNEQGAPVAALTEEQVDKLREIMWAMNAVDYSTHPETITIDTTDEDGNQATAEITETVLVIELTHKTPDEMAADYHFSTRQNTYLQLLQDSRYEELWAELLGGFAPGEGEVMAPDGTNIMPMIRLPFWGRQGSYTIRQL